MVGLMVGLKVLVLLWVWVVEVLVVGLRSPAAAKAVAAASDT